MIKLIEYDPIGTDLVSDYWGNHENSREYWNRRAVTHVILYRGERFYTTMPLPYYLWRREFQRTLVKGVFSRFPEVKSCLEYGCGDGRMAIWLTKSFPHLKVFAWDISEEMMNRARSEARSENVELSFELPDSKTMDIINVSMVFAHMTDKDILEFLAWARNILTECGKLVVFEHVGTTYKGSIYSTRTVEWYRETVTQNGFHLLERHDFRTPFYWKGLQVIDRFVWYAGSVIRLFHRSPGEHFRYKLRHYLSLVLVLLSRRIDRIRPDQERRSPSLPLVKGVGGILEREARGYSFFVFEKLSGE